MIISQTKSPLFFSLKTLCIIRFSKQEKSSFQYKTWKSGDKMESSWFLRKFVMPCPSFLTNPFLSMSCWLPLATFIRSCSVLITVTWLPFIDLSKPAPSELWHGIRSAPSSVSFFFFFFKFPPRSFLHSYHLWAFSFHRLPQWRMELCPGLRGGVRLPALVCCHKSKPFGLYSIKILYKYIYISI